MQPILFQGEASDLEERRNGDSFETAKRCETIAYLLFEFISELPLL